MHVSLTETELFHAKDNKVDQIKMADTTLILVGIGVLVLCLLITVFLLLVYSGLFRTVEVGAGRPPIADVVVAYKFLRGPYKESGPQFTELAKLAPDNKCLGIFYDDPSTVRIYILFVSLPLLLLCVCEF